MSEHLVCTKGIVPDVVLIGMAVCQMMAVCFAREGETVRVCVSVSL